MVMSIPCTGLISIRTTKNLLSFADEVKEKMVNAFLEMNQKEEWKNKLEKHNVWGFKPVEASFYDMDQHIVKNVRKLSLHPTYY